MWLDKSDKQHKDLKAEEKVVQPSKWTSGRMQEYKGLVSVDLIHEYRTKGLKTLNQAREECERLVGDMTRVFGELHFISLQLYTTLGNMLDELGELSKSKALRMRIREQIEKTSGINPADYIQSVINVVRSHKNLGEWMEEQLLQEEILKYLNIGGAPSTAIETVKSNLAQTYRGQGRWKEAEEILVQVIETRKRALGQEHPSTLINKANLALTYRNQGRWKEAEELEVHVMEKIGRAHV